MRLVPASRPSARTAIAAAAALVALTGSAAVAVRGHRRETLKPPVLRIEQTATYVKLHVHNRNKHWSLYGQQVLIDLHSANPGFSIIRSYGPDHDYSLHALPGEPTIHCCVIDLPPGGDYTFTLWPTKQKVTAAVVDLYATNNWRYEP